MRTPVFAVVGLVAFSAGAQPEEPTLFVPHFYALGATVTTYTVNTDGTLTFADNEPSGVWSLGAAVSPDGATLAVGNPAGTDDGSSSTDELYLFRVNADSTLDPIGSALVPTSPMELEWLDNDTLAVLNSDLGNSVINVYDIDLEDGTLTAVDAEITGGFCTSFAIDRNAGLFFAQDSFGNTILRYTLDGTGLTPAGSTVQGSYPLDLTLAPDGSALYSAGGISGGGDALTAFAVNDAANPTPLAALPGSPASTGGESPAHLAVSGDGASLYAGHGGDGDIRGFIINADGSLTPSGALADIGGQGSIGDMTTLGDLLFVTDDDSAGGRGVHVFRTDSKGGLTHIAGPYDTGVPRPEGDLIIWAPETVDCLADTNGDGQLSPADFNAWIQAYNAQAPACDQNGDALCTPADFNAWITNYNAGC